ncbi:exodeoxyribonuclease X [Peteryoungia aggregata LMG 23059]|uniref:Exodeoxyribonuclease X n=1 Tax=Peteryoungia aggregata LMG 23059 TaxID=1368425 RepID=A0ABU0GAI7_9HYPH|nr:exonuclease domain-containing protein [Peteryoungia aggregata]MDQ0422370.1 exodeoxyribonuclease X [Peteryoungia aggregata LMG 23059]
MKLRVIDLETTDRVEAKESGERVGVVEYGYTDVTDQLVIGDTHAAFVNPGFPIPPQGRAVHHISDADVATGVNYMQACQALMKGMETGDVFVAHNAPFEQAFFGGGNFPWICTMRCAQHVFPDAPAYGNQFLRYWLGVDEEIAEPHRAMPPHRAGPDTYVTSYILTRLLLERSPQDLIALTKEMPLLKTLTFTKEHKGKLYSDLDEGLLEWILGKDFAPEVHHTCRYWLRIKRQSRNGIF